MTLLRFDADFGFGRKNIFEIFIAPEVKAINHGNNC